MLAVLAHRNKRHTAQAGSERRGKCHGCVKSPVDYRSGGAGENLEVLADGNRFVPLFVAGIISGDGVGGRKHVDGNFTVEILLQIVVAVGNNALEPYRAQGLDIHGRDGLCNVIDRHDLDR